MVLWAEHMGWRLANWINAYKIRCRDAAIRRIRHRVPYWSYGEIEYMIYGDNISPPERYDDANGR